MSSNDVSKPRRRALRILGAIPPALFALPGHVLAQASGGDGEIRIGQSCQLSGPLSSLTKEIQDGAALYFRQVNARGGVHGRSIRVISKDDGYDPARAAANARSLIEEDGVIALFNVAGTPTTLAVLPVARDHRIPLIAPFTGSGQLRAPFERHVFNARAGYGEEIEKIVQHLSVLGIAHVGVAHLNNSFGKGGVVAVQSAAQKTRISLVATTPLEVDGKGLKETAAEMAHGRPQAIILITAGKITSDFIAAYQAIATGAQFYALSVVSSRQLIDALGDRSKGVAIAQVMPYPWGGASELSREILGLAKAQGIQVTYNHMEGYVSAKLLVEGLKLAGQSPTPETLIRALEGLHALDLGGFILHFSDHNHNGSTYVELTIVGSEKHMVR